MSDQVISRDVVPPLPPVASRARRAFNVKRLAAGVLGLAALAGVASYGHQWWTVGRFIESTDDAYVGGNVTPIAPHVAGYVKEILVGDNQFVAAGQVLLRLEDADYRAALHHAQAVLQARLASITNLESRRLLQGSVIAGAGADLMARQAQAAFAAQEADRYRSLALTSAGSRQDEQKAQASDKAAKAAVLAAQAAVVGANQQLAVLDADIAVAKAELSEAEADLHTAQLNLGYTTITAPQAGYMGNRSAQVGTYVTAGTNLLSIVPAQGLWVDANFKEDQLAQMRPNDSATIVADVLPGRTFQGHVISLSPATGAVFSVIPPQNATGNFTKIVQRVPVRIALDGAAGDLGLLRAGLSTVASVDIRHPATAATGTTP